MVSQVHPGGRSEHASCHTTVCGPQVSRKSGTVSCVGVRLPERPGSEGPKVQAHLRAERGDLRFQRGGVLGRGGQRAAQASRLALPAVALRAQLRLRAQRTLRTSNR